MHLLRIFFYITMVLFLGRIPIIPYLKGKKRNQMVCLILNHRKIEPLFLWSPEVFDCTAHQLKRKKKKKCLGTLSQHVLTQYTQVMLLMHVIKQSPRRIYEKNIEMEKKKVVILFSSLTLMDHDKTCFGDYYFSFYFS